MDVHSKAFTLIELMIVVAIIGVLAAVAIPSFIKYLHDSKHNEAVLNLKTIGDGALTFYQEEHYLDANGIEMITRQYPSQVYGSHFGMSNNDAVGDDCTKVQISIRREPNIWNEVLNSSPWIYLKFHPSQPILFRYVYNEAPNLLKARGQSKFMATASASIDANCDSMFIIMGGPKGVISAILDNSSGQKYPEVECAQADASIVSMDH